MKNGKLILVAIVVAMFASIAVAAGYGYCSEPTRVTQGCDNDGKITMTVTTSVPDEYYRSELGTIGCSLEEHRVQEEITQDEIITNEEVTVDFYVYGEGQRYYPCVLNQITREISVTLTGDNVPPVGSWVGLCFCNVKTDTYDETVYTPLPGTLLNEYKVPGYGNECPLSVLGWSRR